MQLFFIFELIMITMGTVYLFKQYPNKNVHFPVKAICFTAWFLSFVTIILVPLDVFYTIRENKSYPINPSPDNPDSTYVDPDEVHEKFGGMVLIWKIVYWTSFIFTWLVLPLLQEFVDAGEFTFFTKLKRSLKVNLAIYGICAGFGVIFILYLQFSGRFDEEGLVHFLITFSNCFGIVLIIICLSYGLVFIPKRLFQQVRLNQNLKMHQFEAAVLHEQKLHLTFEFEELIKTIDILLVRDDISIRDKANLQEILARAPRVLVEEVQEMIRDSTMAPSAYQKVKASHIAALNKKMKKKLNEMRRLEMKWQLILKQSFFLQDIIESKSPADWKTKESYTPSKFKSFENALGTFEWLWHAYLSRVVALFLGLICVAASVIVFLAEILNFDDFHLFSIETFIKDGGGAVTKSQTLCLIPLFYISLCTYSALFNMKLADRYGLYRHHQTDAASLVFSSLNFSRISSPLVFNFLQMLKLDDTAFHAVMGNVQFAYSFMSYFPLLLVVLILCNVFDVYGRVLTSLGLKKYRFHEESTKEQIEEGKRLLIKARANRRRGSLQDLEDRNDRQKEMEVYEERLDKDSKRSSPFKELVSVPRSYIMNSGGKDAAGQGRSLQDI